MFACSPLLEGGSAVRFSIFVFFVFGSATFAFFCRFSLLRVAVKKNFSGANFCFWVSWLVLCFSIVFCLGFCFYFLAFRSRKCLGKFSSCQVCCFWGFVLFLFGFLGSWLFFQERKLRANRTHPTRTLSLSPPHRVYLPFWPCVLSFSCFVGVPFWAPGILAFSCRSGQTTGDHACPSGE